MSGGHQGSHSWLPTVLDQSDDKDIVITGSQRSLSLLW